MVHKNFFSLAFLLVLNISIYAQQTATYTHEGADFQKAITLYNNNQFQAAQTLFESIKERTKDMQIESDCAYYYANCAIRLNQQNADGLIEDFVEDYPTSVKKNSAYMDVADYYFKNGKYAYARKWYDKVDEDRMSISERDKFSFNYGYSLYVSKDEAGAQKYLNRVVNSKEYGSQANYYIGFMAYEGDDYDKASSHFEQVSDNEKYQEKLSYYQADLNFKLGNFDKAIELAKAQMTKADANEKSELSKVIGESYFNLKQYNEAIPFLKAYRGKNGKWTNNDFYQLGYAYYQQNDFESAISEFNKIIGGANSIAQNAYYHLGESYINLNKKQEALNAFKMASELDFDLKIQEDAWLNYAKISYDIGNPYQSVPQVLTGYLKTYPKSSFKNEVETLLIDSYITSKNYEEALTLLEGKSSFEHKVAYQKVAFYRGIETYNDGDFMAARSLFVKSLSATRDAEFTARATFWKAECDYNNGDYKEALIGFKQFEQFPEAKSSPEITNIDYNLAYTYFKQKNYPQAISYFKDFIGEASNDPLRINDAYLRLADSYFVSSDYQNAIASYGKAVNLKHIEPDYAAFQKAMSYGYIGQGDTKIKELQAFTETYPKSSLRDDALYELANSYVKINKLETALKLYDRLIAEHKNSVFVPKALLRQGLAYYTERKNTPALEKFKKIAKDYPNSEEAIQAVSTARLIYIDQGQVDAYAAWVKTLDYVNVTDVDLDNTTYQAAEKQYLDQNTDNAIKQMNGYINGFPNGLHSLKAHFYLGELYLKKSLPETAQPHYEFVVGKSKSEFSEQALVKLSEIHLNASRWEKAIPLLKRLELEADYSQNILYAQSNLMNAYYNTKKYVDAESYAEKILSRPKIDDKVQSDAKIIIARSAIQTGNPAKAKTAYAEVEKIATGALAAEALFYNAYFKNKDGQFEASNTLVQKLAKDYSSYKYYSAKGLVVMAKNFYGLKDAFQATYILESVITNFAEFTEVVSEAQTELNRIKNEEAKTNSSIKAEN